MRFSRPLFSTFAFVAFLVLASCSSPVGSPSSGGSTSSSSGSGNSSLSITIGNNIAARTLAPTLSMVPASYTVTGSGPNNATFTATTTGTTVTQNSLAFGTWTIVVNALNASGDLIGTGTTTALINTGATTAASVSVTPVSGNGTLTLGVTWPAASVQTPSISASLTPALGTALNLPFTMGSGTASYSNTAVGNGYYTLGFTLQDSGIVVAGAVEVVRIVTGQTTSGTYGFTSVNAPGGTINVGITANMANPLTVAIAGASSTLAQGSTEALTANVSNYTGNVVYVWYVNGVSAGAGTTFTFNAGSVAGYTYRIDVTAFSADGSTAGSATTSVGVTASSGSTLIGQGTPLNLAGLVTTLAGSTTSGSANGTGTAASFYLPFGITTDGTNLFVADAQNNEIRKIAIATNVVTTLAGSTTSGSANGTGTAASFASPRAIATDGTNLYVSDTANNEIRKIVIATGVVTTLAGAVSPGNVNGTGTAASFDFPTGITTDGTNLYVADLYNNEIREIVIATGVVTTLAGSTTSGSGNGTGTVAGFNLPYGIATDGTNLFVTDYGNNEIRKIVIATGVVTTLAGSTTSGSANGTGTAASFLQPSGITTDGANVYVADTNNNEIRKIVISSGTVTTLAGSTLIGHINGTGAAASFFYPNGITTDGTSLYVADSYNNEIREIQ